MLCFQINILHIYIPIIVINLNLHTEHFISFKNYTNKNLQSLNFSFNNSLNDEFNINSLKKKT